VSLEKEMAESAIETGALIRAIKLGPGDRSEFQEWVDRCCSDTALLLDISLILGAMVAEVITEEALDTFVLSAFELADDG